MEDDILIQISNKLKEARTAKGTTVQEIATRAHVSKGLISQIENNRTIPSLPVLFGIIKALNVDLTVFFKDVASSRKQPRIVHRKPAEYQPFQKENAKGFLYQRVITRTIRDHPVDIVLLQLKKGAVRTKLVKTQAFEFKYIIKGQVQYLIEGKKYQLEEGDSLFFDGRMGHTLANKSKKSEALILVVYFFI